MTNKKATTDNLKNQLAKSNGTTPANADPVKTIQGYLKAMAPRIKDALPERLGMTPERMAQIAITTMRMNPALQKADPASFLSAVMQSAQLGLQPNLLGSCYFIPFENKKRGVHEVQFLIGYRGLIDLVRRSGDVLSIQAKEVRQGDLFEFEYGLNENLRHIPEMTPGNRGEITHFYAYAKLKNGGHAFEVMTAEEINHIRDEHSVSYKYQKGNSVWGKHYEAMGKKTVIKQLIKFLPISIDLQEQVATDETVRKDITSEPEYLDLDDLEVIEVDNQDTDNNE